MPAPTQTAASPLLLHLLVLLLLAASMASAFFVAPVVSPGAAARRLAFTPAGSRHSRRNAPRPVRPTTTTTVAMVQGGGRIEAGKAGAAPAAAEDVTKDPRVVAAFGRTGFFDPFYAFGVDELAPGGAATAAGTEAEADARPVLLYLPGLDGSGLTAFVQYPTLAEAFELRCLTVPMSDRSSFMDLVELVRAELRAYRGRELFIMGESFGGLLALGTALETTNRPDAEPTADVKGVVLVNPATSFSRTLWSKIGPVIARLPQPLYTLGMIPIGLLLIDAGQIESMMGEIKERIANKGRPTSPEAQRAKMEALGLSSFQLAFYTRALPVLLQKLDLLPPDCLSHRLRQWLSFGSDLVAPQLHRLKYPCLVVAGTVDNLLPSYEEAQRLEKELPDCQVHYCEGAGHGGTLDQRVEVLQILKKWRPVGEVLARTAPAAATANA